MPDKQRALIELPADQLLAEFGAGGHSPGSGSAAALMGMLAAQMIITVCTISNQVNQENNRELNYILERSISIHEKLKILFQQDADEFNLVIGARQLRNAEPDPDKKRPLREKALRLLRNCTETVFDIGEQCSNLVDLSLDVFDIGARKVQGDSGAAISSSLAGCTTSLFVINLNLSSFQGGQWAQAQNSRVDSLYQSIIDNQALALSKIQTPEHRELIDKQLTLEFN